MNGGVSGGALLTEVDLKFLLGSLQLPVTIPIPDGADYVQVEVHLRSLQEDVAEQHAAQMREFADARIHLEGHHERDYANDQNEVFHLNRNQERPQDGSSGIHHGVGQQDPENRARASDGPAQRIAPRQDVVRQDDANPRADSTIKVEANELAGAPVVFQVRPEQPERQPVPNNMTDTAMQEQ